MVATSKMKRAQESAKCGRPYALLLADVIGSLSSNLQESGQAFFESRPVKHRGVLVLSTDKGLCGALNANLFRIVHEVDASAKFVAVGKRATQYLSRTRRDLLADFTVSDRAPFSEVRPSPLFRGAQSSRVSPPSIFGGKNRFSGGRLHQFCEHPAARTRDRSASALFRS